MVTEETVTIFVCIGGFDGKDISQRLSELCINA